MIFDFIDYIFGFGRVAMIININLIQLHLKNIYAYIMVDVHIVIVLQNVI